MSQSFLINFLRSSIGAGVVLFLMAIAAVLFANLPGIQEIYAGFLHLNLSIGVGSYGISEDIHFWVNDALMAVFFLFVSLEIKRELLEGELSSPRLAAMPAIAAFGGAITPAIIFALLNKHDPILLRGWAVPMATDIAFSLAVLALLGTRIPISLKIFLTAVAIIDDMIAIVVIAVFYASELKVDYLVVALAIMGIMGILNASGVKRIGTYLLLGLFLWLATLESGLHATLAGVATAAFIPCKNKDGESPLKYLEHALKAPVIYFIMPLFAFVNAGVNFAGITAEDFGHSLMLGITLGLILGKPIGIIFSIWLSIKLKIAELPRASNWLHIVGVSMICGIGFTVSLFIGNLAFLEVDVNLDNITKMAVLLGSIISGILGYSLLRVCSRNK